MSRRVSAPEIPCAAHVRGGRGCLRRACAGARSATRTRSRRSTARSCASSSNPWSAAPESRTSRSTSTCCSASRPWRCAGPGTRPTWSRSARARRTSSTATSTTSTSRAARSARAATTSAGTTASPAAGRPTVYAHVATDPAHPGKLALQYWFFYVFNDFNNTARRRLGDDPARLRRGDAAEALHRSRPRSATARTRAPSGPTGATRSSSSSTGRTRSSTPPRDRTRTSSAPPLYLGSSAEAGVGCDDTRGPHDELRPTVKTIPSDPAAAARRSRGSPSRGAGASFSQRSSTVRPARTSRHSGPSRSTGREGWRSRSYAVPTAGVFGTGATDFFCNAVETGSAA